MAWRLSERVSGVKVNKAKASAVILRLTLLLLFCSNSAVTLAALFLVGGRPRSGGANSVVERKFRREAEWGSAERQFKRCRLGIGGADSEKLMQGRSSIGRALVSKTRGCEFDSRRPCHFSSVALFEFGLFEFGLFEFGLFEFGPVEKKRN
jgi:hypothetical protein